MIDLSTALTVIVAVYTFSVFIILAEHLFGQTKKPKKKKGDTSWPPKEDIE